MDRIRRVGGELDTHRRPSGRRAVLLPFEVDLCEQLGITAEEYWTFIANAQDFVKERPPEYAEAGVPHVVNEPVSIITSLVVGIALSAIGYLLTPKPKQPKEEKKLGPLGIDGERGRTRYTKASNFDSVQSLASLGETIPLVFADRKTNTKTPEMSYGGIRVDSQLLWSQMVTGGTTQTLMAVMLLGAGVFRENPDYKGFAIGDLLLRDYSPHKNQLYFSPGRPTNNRLKAGYEGDQYKESKLKIDGDRTDAFSLYWAPTGQTLRHFSGARTPSTNTQFGLHNPMPNGHRFMMPWELTLMPVNQEDGSDVRKQANNKRKKVGTIFPRLAGINRQSGDKVTYLVSDKRLNTDDEDFEPWGLGDILQTQDETRIMIDDTIQEGQEFMLGSARAICVSRPNESWTKYYEGNFLYEFELTDGGRVPVVGGQNDIESSGAGRGAAGPWDRGCVQQLAVATLTNTRPCDATEIGIRSEVWRQMQGAANFNDHPDPETVEKYEEAQSTINLGTITKYTKRYSFFRLYARELGADRWKDISGGATFAVLGASPELLFNTLFVEHEFGQHEFQILPVPGSEFFEAIQDGSVAVHLLNGTPLSRREANGTTGTNSGYTVYYTGKNYQLSIEDATNPEWVFGYREKKQKPGEEERGPIDSLDSSDNGKPIIITVTKKSLGYDFRRGEDPQGKTMVQRESRDGTYSFWWNGELKASGKPNPQVNIDAQGRQFQYRIYEDEPPESEWTQESWSDRGKEWSVVYDDDTPDFQYAVVLKDGVYEYWWNGGKKISTATNSSNWVDGPNDARYQKSGKKTDAGTERMPTAVQQNLFTVKRQDGYGIRAISDGVEKTEGGQLIFWRNGVRLGTSQGRWFQDGPVWWYRDDEIRQRETDPFYELIREERNIRPWQGTVLTTVKDGVVRMPLRSIGQPQFGEDEYWWFNGGKRLARTSYRTTEIDVTGQGAKNGRYKVNRSRGSVTLEDPRGGNEGPYKIYYMGKYQIINGLRSMWGMSKYRERKVYDTWQIWRQDRVPGKDGKYWIEKLERNIQAPEDPDRSVVPLTVGGNSTATVTLKTYPKSERYEWKIKSGGKGYAVNERVSIGDTGQKAKVTAIRKPGGDINDPTGENFMEFIEPGNNYSPLNAICDYFINNTDNSSHTNGPEHAIIFCNELLKQAGQEIPRYEGLGIAGIKLLNAKEWTSFSSVSAYIKHGHMVDRLFVRSDPSSAREGIGATNLFPEIAYHLLTDDKYGAGELIGAESVDRNAMKKAAQFCYANGLYWDGVISENQNLRSFIFENAAYMLLDFTIKGGQFALIPALPYGSDFKINNTKPIEIKALYTDGNMRNMEVSFLSPEERQPFKGVCLYRKETENGFPEIRTMTMRLSDSAGGSDADPIERFDCTAFMTTEDHARKFLRYALKLRKVVDHAIKFETTPQSAMNMEPGDYFRVASHTTHTERFKSGSIDFAGNVVCADPLPVGSTTSVVYWRPGETTLRETTASVDANGRVNNGELKGTLFCRKTSASESRVYRCESLSYSEDGLVEISGSVTPVEGNNTLQALNWRDQDFDEIAY